MMTLKRVAEICSQFHSQRILVFGDVILDRYIFGDVNRISPEAPVPVVKVKTEESRAGGAGNVAVNIDKLGACGILLGITGDDRFAEEISRLKPEHNFVLRSHLVNTVVKTRVIAHTQQVVRIDREDILKVAPLLEEAVLQKIKEINREKLAGIVVSDYAKGTLTGRIMESLKAIAAGRQIPILVDPKPPNFHLYRGITGITPNLKEAEMIVNRRIDNDYDAAQAVKLIGRKYQTQFTVITRGDRGMTAAEKGKRVFHLPAVGREVYDVTGAGDTVVAVLALSLVSGASLKEAIYLANAAASIVVEKIGTSQVTTEEMFARMQVLLKRKNSPGKFSPPD